MEIDTLENLKDDFKFSQKPNFFNIDRKDLTVITKSLDGTSANTAGNYGVILNVKSAYIVSYVATSWQTASTSGTLNLERLSGTEALDAGDTIFVSNVSLSGTANTINIKSGKDLQNIILKSGDRLALKDSGDLTNQVGVCVTIYLRPLGKGDYA
jgi:hypothetical protein